MSVFPSATSARPKGPYNGGGGTFDAAQPHTLVQEQSASTISSGAEEELEENFTAVSTSLRRIMQPVLLTAWTGGVHRSQLQGCAARIHAAGTIHHYLPIRAPLH